MTSKTVGEEVTKASIRKKIWDHIEDEDLANFPRPVHHRIPNFKGAAEAGDRAAGLDVFKDSQTVKINPDKPQEQCRFKTLEAHKKLLVPTPRLRSGLFNRINPPADANKETLRICATAQENKVLLVSTPRRKTGLFSQITPPEDADQEKLKICSTAQGVREYSSPIGLEDKVKVDLVIVGSVAVSEKGWRIGKGEGFADLEYAMMASMGAVDENTIIVTTVHDCQVTDIPDTLIENHDIVVDYIVTPTKVIECEHRKKPSGIIWSKITRDKLQQVPILKKLRKMEEEAGKDVTIREDRSNGDAEGRDAEKKDRRRDRENRNRRGYFRQRERRPRGNWNKDSESGDGQQDGEGKSSNPDSPNADDRPRRRPRRPRRRSNRTSEGQEGGSQGEGEDKENMEDDRNPRRRQYRRFNNRRRRQASNRSEDGGEEGGDSEGRDDQGSPRQGGRRMRRQRPRRPRDSEGDDRKDRSSGDEEEGGEQRRRRRRRPDDNTASIFVGGLPRSVRVSEFKTKVRDRGVQPLRVVWRGGNGHAFLVIENKDDADGVVKALQGLSIKDKDLRIELSNRSAGKDDDPRDMDGQD